MRMDETQPRTLYVGNLHHSVSEDLLVALFNTLGAVVKSCKIIREPGNDPYAFIEFTSHQSAATLLTAMNKRSFLDREIKVNWATSPGNQPKTDTSSHHHIFVGDLSPEIETETLREAFAPFGEISNCRIVRDPHTMKSKGYAFVSFVKKAEAESAIQAMNGQWLGSRSIRTNWSTRKPPPPREQTKSGFKTNRATYEEIYNQTSPTNSTVYCGGFPQNVISEDLMHRHFSQFGNIQDIRVFKDKGFSFIKFTSKDSAAHAIENTHNTDVNGYPVKCFWGKENGGDSSNMSGSGNMGSMGGPGNVSNAQAMAGQVVTQQYPYAAAAAAAYQQMGYWYTHAGYQSPMQAAQYMQQGYYPYAYTTQQQQQAANSGGYRMVQPTNVSPWATVPGSVPAGVTVGTPATNGNATQQQMMYSAAMQQYQTQ